MTNPHRKWGIIMTISKDFVNIYKKYLREINDFKRSIKYIEHMKRKVEKKQLVANEEEIYLVEKQQLTKDDEFTCNKEKLYNFSNGDKYIGKIEKNELHGKGYYVMYDDEGIIMEYMGEFKNNMREGIGQCKLKNGNLYIGEFRDDLMNGLGEMIYNNGDIYIGQWLNGRKDGLGIFTWSDNTRYNGEFRNGKMEGEGQCFDQSGNLIYEGQWKNDYIHGLGTYIWNDNKKYEGEFKHGKKHGKGSFYLNGDLIYEGTWRFDKPSVFGRSLEEFFCVNVKL